SHVIAFRASGRLKVRMASGPCVSYVVCSLDTDHSFARLQIANCKWQIDVEFLRNMSPQALSGLRVLDVTQVMAGPFCTMILADLGAEVIKIEPPGGDSTRQMPGAVGTDSPSFNAVNRGKRSIVLNLKSPAGARVLERMARSADIFVENYRPGVM